MKPYYLAYEDRYRKVYEAGADCWGYSQNDTELWSALSTWVDEYQLKGKRIIEYACGEGAAGVILSQLGCIYHGVDISPSALKKAKEALALFPDASVSLLDMVTHHVDGIYDAALDVMGLHMIIVDSDREAYLKNAFACVKSGAPMLFYDEAYRSDAYEENVDSFEQWVKLYSIDLVTPEKRTAKRNGEVVDVYIPLLAARTRTKDGYLADLEKVGFVVDRFEFINGDMNTAYSVSIYTSKPCPDK